MSWKTWSTWVRFIVVFGVVFLVVAAMFATCFLQDRPLAPNVFEPVVCTLIRIPVFVFGWGPASIFHKIPAQSPFWDWFYYIFNIIFYGLVAAGIAFLATRRRAK